MPLFSITILSILLCVMLVMLGIMFHIRNKQMEREYYEKTAHLLELSNTLSHRQKEVYAWISELRLGRMNIIQGKKREKDSFLANYYETQLHLSDFERCSCLCNKRLDNFMTALSNEYPDLSEKDLELLMLYLLHVPESDIRLVMKYSSNSLPTIKTRLTKKLKLQRASELEQHLEQLVAKI